MKLDPRQLEVLAAIVDTGGLTEAAHRLGKSQPSLSRSVSTLEQRLGAALFLSGKRPLQPTELCLRLAEEGRRILAANAAAADVVQGYRAGKSGAVRVGGTPIFMDGVISGMLASLQAANP
jgi:DNA-binding transcriptional LysR family regulator